MDDVVDCYSFVLCGGEKVRVDVNCVSFNALLDRGMLSLWLLAWL